MRVLKSAPGIKCMQIRCLMRVLQRALCHPLFSSKTKIGYHLSFTLLVPDPQFYTGGWNIEEAVEGLYHSTRL